MPCFPSSHSQGSGVVGVGVEVEVEVAVPVGVVPVYGLVDPPDGVGFSEGDVG